MSSRSIPRHTYCAVLVAAILLAASAGACAQPTPGQATSATVAKPLPFVSPIFGDNMVLQRGKPDTIWGWSDPGDTVRVQIGESTAIGTAGPDRRWQVQIQPPAPGGPYTDGANVVVSSSSVPNPSQVRYAWQSNPAATLFNGAGLPAGPFRTDTWSGKTEGHRPY